MNSILCKQGAMQGHLRAVGIFSLTLVLTFTVCYADDDLVGTWLLVEPQYNEQLINEYLDDGTALANGLAVGRWNAENGILYTTNYRYSYKISGSMLTITNIPNRSVVHKYRRLNYSYFELNTLFLRGYKYISTGNYDLAIADFNAILRANPKEIRLLVDLATSGRAQAYNKKGNHDLAIADYNAVIKANPNPNPKDIELITIVITARLGLGSSYLVKGDYDKAIADFSATIKACPKNASATINTLFMSAMSGRGAAYFEKGNDDLALADFNAVIKVDELNADALALRYALHLRNKNYDLALADCKKLISLGILKESAIEEIKTLKKEASMPNKTKKTSPPAKTYTAEEAEDKAKAEKALKKWSKDMKGGDNGKFTWNEAVKLCSSKGGELPTNKDWEAAKEIFAKYDDLYNAFTISGKESGYWWSATEGGELGHAYLQGALQAQDPTLESKENKNFVRCKKK